MRSRPLAAQILSTINDDVLMIYRWCFLQNRKLKFLKMNLFVSIHTCAIRKRKSACWQPFPTTSTHKHIYSTVTNFHVISLVTKHLTKFSTDPVVAGQSAILWNVWFIETFLNHCYKDDYKSKLAVIIQNEIQNTFMLLLMHWREKNLSIFFLPI